MTKSGVFQLFKEILIIMWLLPGAHVFAQEVEYRITDDRRYQYLSDRREAGMIFDESLGTYYTDITVRTFYLETIRRGYIPANTSYNTFTKMTLAEQRALLNQPFSERDCSSNSISSECLDFIEQKIEIPVSEHGQVVDLSPKCVPGESPQSRMSLTSKLLVNPNDASVENNDCEDKAPPPTTDDSRQKQQKMSTVKIILGKD